MDGRNNDFVGRKSVHQQANGGDVGNSVHSANLVEMDIAYRHAVGMALRLGDERINRHHVVLYLFGYIKVASYDVFYIVQTAVVMMGMTVLMAVLVHVVVLMVMLVLMVVLVVMMMLVFVVVLVVMMMSMMEILFIHAVYSN